MPPPSYDVRWKMFSRIADVIIVGWFLSEIITAIIHTILWWLA